ncbi:MAG TPA: hypothetical protein VLM79_08615, partial [Kofleriaceae bacterium]|nr:hypothetical protein [Kofleriaceae bacterium]
PMAEYYASITALPLPAPTPIDVVDGAGRHDGALGPDEVLVFTAKLGSGVNDIAIAMPGAAAASLTVENLGQLAACADENPGPPATQAAVSVSGISPGDNPVIAVDAVYNYGPAPEPFTLTVTAR